VRLVIEIIILVGGIDLLWWIRRLTEGW